MGCSGKRALHRTAALYSNATTTGIFVPVLGPLDLRGATEVAVRSEVIGVTSSNLAWKPAVRYADVRDDLASAASSDLGSEQTGAGIAYVQFVSLPGTPKRWGELGYVVRNSSGTQVEKGAVVARFDLRLT